MRDDEPDTSPDTRLLQLIHDELSEVRARLFKVEKRLNIIERVANGLKMSIELIQDQYQENGSAIASIQSICRKRGEILSRLISKSSQPPGENDDIGGMDERRRSKT